MKSALLWIFLVAVVATVFFSVSTYGSASHSPNLETGQVWPISDHGQIKYVSQMEHAYVQAIPWIAAIIVRVGLVVLFIILARRVGTLAK